MQRKSGNGCRAAGYASSVALLLLVAAAFGLPGANAQAIGRERKPFLVIGFDDVQQFVTAELRTGCPSLGDQIVNDGPALCIQLQADGLGPVTENETQEFAELNRIGRQKAKKIPCRPRS